MLKHIGSYGFPPTIKKQAGIQFGHTKLPIIVSKSVRYALFQIDCNRLGRLYAKESKRRGANSCEMWFWLKIYIQIKMFLKGASNSDKQYKTYRTSIKL